MPIEHPRHSITAQEPKRQKGWTDVRDPEPESARSRARPRREEPIRPRRAGRLERARPERQRRERVHRRNGWDDYALWHLGEDPEADPETKQRYSFPYGDFRRVHRCAVISLESRAAQNDHDDITRASKKLLSQIDED
ncbi:hypothetical protein LLS1_03810 [Leifsonia sp. LS1]|nr:hypothetical protein LLS1_03810 [Leifsonia sp. LS1]